MASTFHWASALTLTASVLLMSAVSVAVADDHTAVATCDRLRVQANDTIASGGHFRLLEAPRTISACEQQVSSTRKIARSMHRLDRKRRASKQRKIVWHAPRDFTPRPTSAPSANTETNYINFWAGKNEKTKGDRSQYSRYISTTRDTMGSIYLNNSKTQHSPQSEREGQYIALGVSTPYDRVAPDDVVHLATPRLLFDSKVRFLANTLSKTLNPQQTKYGIPACQFSSTLSLRETSNAWPTIINIGQKINPATRLDRTGVIGIHSPQHTHPSQCHCTLRDSK